MFKLHKNSFLMLIHERDTIKRWSCRLIFLKTSEPNNFLKFDSNYSHIFRSGQQLDPTRDVLRLHRSNLVQIFTFAWQPCWALSSIRHFTNSSILSGKVVQSVSNQNLLVDDGTNLFHVQSNNILVRVGALVLWLWKRLMLERSWVWILAPYTGWTWHFSLRFVVKIIFFIWKDQK